MFDESIVPHGLQRRSPTSYPFRMRDLLPLQWWAYEVFSVNTYVPPSPTLNTGITENPEALCWFTGKPLIIVPVTYWGEEWWWRV